MRIPFYKYQGTGNDFVMIDNFSGEFDNLSISDIQFLCDRKFGIGADGLIKLNAHDSYDFEMDYYNADGSKSFCGNGARCSVAFARFLGKINSETNFIAIDGEHQAFEKNELIHLKMKNVSNYETIDNDFILHTGSPHYIHFTSQNKTFDIVEFGMQIRYSDRFKKEGINVNSTEIINSHSIDVRTYERGVEDETLSCGTGVTAAALAFAVKTNLQKEQKIQIQTLGGELAVSFERNNMNTFSNIYLIGPAVNVFKGEIDV